MKKCAIYTRVSTSMQADKNYNSCEAQKDKIVSYIKSQEDLAFHKEYSDPAFSGSNIDRPALRELLRDITLKKIEVVLAYKIDRLTRSSKDFYSLIEFFEKHGVIFVSVSERFDTSSASGRLLRNIMLTFAQFERELTGERTRDKMLQRAEKGMWNGKSPFGYKLQDKRLVIDNRRSLIVKEIFQTFAVTGSLMKTMSLVKKNDWKSEKSNKPLTTNGVFHILRNPAYAGNMTWAGKVYKSIHEPIISKELFNHVQSLTKEKVIKKHVYKEYFLKGRIKCSVCSSTMTPYLANGRSKRYYYYKCFKTVREGYAACSIKEVNADKLETFLINSLSRIAKDKQYIENFIFKALHSSGYPRGFEPMQEVQENLVTRIQQVLIDFKNQTDRSTQVEKCLVFQKTIKGIKFSKASMEVVLNIEDVNKVEVGNSVENLLGGWGQNLSEGAVNPDAPACSSGSLLKNGDPNGIRTRVITVKG
jgi:site-specific DNA recombinase